jgi:hypothetical protein
VKIRGTALHIAEKYVQLARDAQSSGDRVAEQSYLQHAEHYYRIVAAAQAQMPQPQTFFRSDEEGDDDFDERGGYGPAGGQREVEQAFGVDAPQPYVNGNGGYNGGAARPEPPPAQPSSMAGESDGEDEGADAAAMGGGQAGEQPQYRTRRRRQNRGRFRRQEDGGNPGQGRSDEGGQPSAAQPVHDREPSFSED